MFNWVEYSPRTRRSLIDKSACLYIDFHKTDYVRAKRITGLTADYTAINNTGIAADNTRATKSVCNTRPTSA